MGLSFDLSLVESVPDWVLERLATKSKGVNE